jgi:tyramine---L-glutamate ligase
MKVWVHEYLSGGGPADPHEAAELMPQGVAMRDAVAADLLAVPGVRVSVSTHAGAPAPPAGAWPVHPPPGRDPLPFVAGHAADHDAVWLIAPETDGLLAALHAAVGPARGLGCAAEAIAIGASKAATATRLAAHGVPTPLAFTDAPAGDGPGPWVVKPDDGAGAVHTRRHAHRDAAWADLAARHARGDRAVAEPWVDGEPLSLTLRAHRGGVEVLSVNRQRIHVADDGTVGYAGVVIRAWPDDDPRQPRLAALANDVARALPGLRGVVGVDLVWHPVHGPVVIEVNPRTTCAYVGLSAALGRNLAAEVLADRGFVPGDGPCAPTRPLGSASRVEPVGAARSARVPQ